MLDCFVYKNLFTLMLSEQVKLADDVKVKGHSVCILRMLLFFIISELYSGKYQTKLLYCQNAGFKFNQFKPVNIKVSFLF